ncbi:protein C3orf33 homolog isoform X2 [Myripristis murdjan]|uniref:protein C3orf33 homolog isoform X2 n=1 Tax=Myripristis murdjan TaxID=586833 RepID=UPI001175F440|nr:protein C3orf33 homolog isoform X2 [Myripristis murdjan]
MPGTSSDTDRHTEREKRGKEALDQQNQPSHNIVSIISQFGDDNLSLVRNISTGLALAGVIVIARSIRLMTKFKAASEIPARFIERNVSLRGKVHGVTEEGLSVEHVPIHVPGLSPLLSKHKGVCASPLLVHLAGVELTPEGRAWLEENLDPAQLVWLKLISREEDTLHCLVSHSKGSMWSSCINEEVLWLGLARTAPISGVPPDSHLYWRLHKRLLKAEGKAERKGRGLWKEDSLWQRASKAVGDNTVFRLMKRLFRRS